MCVVFLSGVVIFKSIKNDIGGPVDNPSNPVQWWPQDFGGLLTAIAISGLTFSCHFNILPMHGELQHQTRANKRIILYSAMAITYVLNLLVSFFGFFQVRQIKLWNENYKLCAQSERMSYLTAKSYCHQHVSLMNIRRGMGDTYQKNLDADYVVLKRFTI